MARKKKNPPPIPTRAPVLFFVSYREEENLSGSFGSSFLDIEPPLLPEDCHPETVKVVQLSSPVLTRNLLGPGGLGPFGLDALGFPALGHLAGARSTGERLDNEWGEDQVGEGSGMTGDGGGRRSVNQDLRGRRWICQY